MKPNDENLISKFKSFKSKVQKIIHNFSLTERVIFSILIIILVFSTLSSLIRLNATFLKEIPQKGGTLSEGLIGTPRFINPVIAISDTDRDISRLIYSGLLKINSNGDLVNDLAENLEISEDGLNYFIKIRDDAFFHDGNPVTVDDLIFTIQKTQDPTVKSSKRPNWDGVLIEKISDKEIEFTLSQPYSPFIYNLTLGILPKHIWEKISSDEFAFSKYNLEPIGAGPYKIKKIERDNDGIAEEYVLESYNRYAQGEPYIEEIKFKFYKNEKEIIQALNKGSIDSTNSISPNYLSELNLRNSEILTSEFSRTFALYFNQAENDALAEKTVREALRLAAPQQEVIDEILLGYANPISSPILNDLSATESSTSDIERAQTLLIENAWKPNEEGVLTKETSDKIMTLRFDISTANVEELVKVSEKIAENYRKIGADVNVKIFEPNDLTLNVIRPRDFESIFFGQVVNRDLDYYAFWHSSQRNDPGLNIADFTNIGADSALEKIRTTFDKDEQIEALQNFEKEVINDLPAIFLYSPDFIYVVSNNLNLQLPQMIVTSSERFNDIEKWYIETELVWKIFAK